MSKPAMKTFLLCWALLLALPALAAPDATAKARAVFQAAQALYTEGRFDEALAKFQEAQQLKPHPVLVFNIARCHEQLGALAKALEGYRAYLKQLPTATDRDAVRASIAGLEKRLKKTAQPVRVSVEPAGSVVKIDGRPVPSAPEAIELPDGEHQLEVSAPGFEPMQRTFTLSGRPLELSIALRALVAGDAPKRDPGLTPVDPPPPPPPLVVQAEPAPRGRPGTFIAGGVSLAAVGTGTALGVLALSTQATLRGSERSRPDADTLVTEGQAFATGANVAWGVAGAAAVTAVILFFVEGK